MIMTIKAATYKKNAAMKRVIEFDKWIILFVFFQSSQERSALGTPMYPGSKNITKKVILFKIEIVR